MTSTPPPRSPLSVLQAHDRDTAARVLPMLDRATAADAAAGDAVQAHERETAARVLPMLERATRADLDALQVLTRAPVDMARHLDRADDHESENYHNGEAP